MTRPAVVALGGGHGLAASLGALRHLTDRLTAVVTVADDGGSSGRLRRELGVLPPGDLRMALAALCEDGEWGSTWRDVLQHRFASQGELHHHSVGNLLIVALWELLGDTVDGLDWVGRLLGARGPGAADELGAADHRGQTSSAWTRTTRTRCAPSAASPRSRVTPGRVTSVRLVPDAPPACEEAVAAVRSADWVVLGPGSWFTSVMPHLLVPELADALCTTSAKRLITLNLVDEEETGGFSGADLLDAVARAPARPAGRRRAGRPVDGRGPAPAGGRGRPAGRQLAVFSVAQTGRPGVHDPLRLAAAYRDVLR